MKKQINIREGMQFEPIVEQPSSIERSPSPYGRKTKFYLKQNNAQRIRTEEDEASNFTHRSGKKMKSMIALFSDRSNNSERDIF